MEAVKMKDPEAARFPLKACHVYSEEGHMGDNINDETLFSSPIFNGGKCLQCGCESKFHVKICYELKRIDHVMKHGPTDRMLVNRAPTYKKNQKNELNGELKMIHGYCAEFEAFLAKDMSENWLSSVKKDEMYNCDVTEHADMQVFHARDEIMEDHRVQVVTILNDIKDGEKGSDLTLSKAETMMVELYGLKYCGSMLFNIRRIHSEDGCKSSG